MNEVPSISDSVEPSAGDEWIAREAHGDDVLERLITQREAFFTEAAKPGNTSGYVESLPYPNVQKSQLQLLHEAIAARQRQLGQETATAHVRQTDDEHIHNQE